MKQKDKGCGICKNKLYDNEEYVEVIHYKNTKIESTGYYHHACFLERLRDTKYLEAQAQDLLNKTRDILQRFEDGSNE